MVPYIVLWLWVIIVGLFFLKRNSNDKNKKRFLFCSFAAMFILQAYRSLNVGADTREYLRWFRTIGALDWSQLKYFNNGQSEYGWVLLNKVISRFTENNYQWLLAVASIIILFQVVVFIYKNCDDVFLPTCLFLGLGHFLTSMSSLRQYIALAFVLSIYTSMKNRKYVRAIIFAVLAYFFHTSSIIASICVIGIFILIHLEQKGIKIYNKLLIVSISLSLYLVSNIQWIEIFLNKYLPKYLYYYNKDMAMSGRGSLDVVYFVFELIVILFVVFYAYKNIELKYESLLLVIAMMIILLQDTIDHLWRFGFYFSFFLIKIIPEIINKYFKNDWAKEVVRYSIVFLAISLFFYYVITSPDTFTYEFLQKS